MEQPTQHDPSWTEIERAWTARQDDPDRLSLRRRRFTGLIELLVAVFLFWA